MRKILFLFLMPLFGLAQFNPVFFYQSMTAKNTFIGGISATVNTPALLASKLGISSTRVRNFTVSGSDISCTITGGSYGIPNSSFLNDTSITYYNDKGGIVSSISYAAFKGCTSLSSITFNKVTSITSDPSNNGSGTFYGCTALTTVSLPSLISDANAKINMFYGCTGLTLVNMPLYNGIIGIGMFQNCTSLTTINLSITGAIGQNAFVGTKITSVDLTNATSIGAASFSDVITLVGVLVGNNITSISGSAFKNTRITSISSTSCTFIDQGAFYNCISLTSVGFDNVTSVKSSYFGGNGGTFQNCTALSSVSLPKLASDANTKDAMFQNCSSLTTLSFPLYNGIIGGDMFSGCTLLTSVNIGVSGAIGQNAFVGTKITAIDLTNATSIGAASFSNVATLVGALEGNNITTIGNNAFQNTKITSFSSTSCITIGLASFYGCTMLTSVVFSNVSTVNSSTLGGNSGTFQNCTSLTTASFAKLNAISSNGSCMFQGCSAITTISMPLLTALGGTTGNDSNFLNIKTGCSITVPFALQTANAGAPDGDLVYASGTRGAIITYVP